MLDDIVWRCNIPVRSIVQEEEEDNLRSYNLYVKFNSDCKSILNTLERRRWRLHYEQLEGMHVKGRVIEAGLTGTALIEHADAQTNRWFIPEEDNTTYKTIEDIRSRIYWVDSHPSEAQQIAKNLHTKVLRDHSPRIFWNDIFRNDIFWNDIFWNDIFWNDIFWNDIFWNDIFERIKSLRN